MNCQICQSPTERFEDEKTKRIYTLCPHCEFISKSPEIYPDFEVQEARYNLHQNNEDDLGYRAYFQRFLDFIFPLLEKKIEEKKIKNALDFGCGRTSLLAQMLAKEDISCDYYDPIYHPHTLEENKKYDLIVSTEVFEHLHSPKEVFSSLVDKLNMGGYLAIQTQFHANEIEAFKKWYYHQDPTHIVFFTAKTFKVLSDMYSCDFVDDNKKNMILIKKFSLH